MTLEQNTFQRTQNRTFYIAGNVVALMANQKSESKAKNMKEQSCPSRSRTFSVPLYSSLTDRFGNIFYFGNADDIWMPCYPLGDDMDYHTHLRNIHTYEMRPDDILICSLPKTGHHWNEAIIRMLLNKTTQHIDDTIHHKGWLDVFPKEVGEHLESPRLLFTHLPFRHLPRQVLEKKIKVVYLNRNPKDVFVSLYNHVNAQNGYLGYHGTFEHFFLLLFEVGYFYGDIFNHLMEWQGGIESHPELPVHTVIYEEMKLDPIGEVKKLNAFLGTNCSDALCEEISVACSFPNLSAFKNQHLSEEAKAMYKGRQNPIFRKGAVGDWKNWFTVAMNEFFDKEWKKRMSGYKTKYRYTLP